MQTSIAAAADLRLPADEFGRGGAGGGGLGEAALDRPSGEPGDEKRGDEGVAGAGAVLDLAPAARRRASARSPAKASQPAAPRLTTTSG